VTENASRVFHTADSGKTWTVSETPLVTGLNQGVFSVAVVDAVRLVIVGGDYDHPQMVKPISAYSDDGGKSGKVSSHRPAGYRWGCRGCAGHARSDCVRGWTNRNRLLD
jgi:hypothetical protein